MLKRKNVLLFISSLDISDDDISILRPIHDTIKKEDQYKIIWIPIVDEWTEDSKKKFEILRSKMPWYVVQYYSPIAGIRFVKEKWNFTGKPSVVVLNPQGKVECENALHMIRVWGIKAFPFTSTVEETLTTSREWIGSIGAGIHPNIENWVKFISPIYKFIYVLRLCVCTHVLSMSINLLFLLYHVINLSQFLSQFDDIYDCN